jgi:hypothetical protein
VVLAFYGAWREAEVAGIGGAAVVNGVLNGAIIEVKGGNKMRSSKGGL